MKVLQKGGYSEKKAKSTAFALLEADKKGIFSHGTAGGTGIEEAIKRSGITSTVRLDTEPILELQKYPTLIVINADGAPGHYTSDFAITMLKKVAREYGYAKAYVYNANHYGAAGVWSNKIAEDGDLRGTSTCTTVAVARVMGDDINRLDYTIGAGKENRVGTNPLAISIPHVNGVLTFDTAWTRMAVSYCLKHLKSSELMTIPEYIANSEFKSTLDPHDFADSMETLNEMKGSVFPHGSTLAGYKGDSMLRMIEIDNAIGGGPIVKVPLGGVDTSRRISHTFEAQAIDCLYSLQDAKNRVRALMQDYEAKYFGEKSRWPSDRASEAMKYSMLHGIPYSSGQVDTLRRTTEYVGLDLDLQSLGRKDYPIDLFNK